MKKFLNQNSKIKSILICLFLVILIVISEIFSFFSYQNDKKKYEMEEIKWKKIEAEKEEREKKEQAEKLKKEMEDDFAFFERYFKEFKKTAEKINNPKNPAEIRATMYFVLDSKYSFAKIAMYSDKFIYIKADRIMKYTLSNGAKLYVFENAVVKNKKTHKTINKSSDVYILDGNLFCMIDYNGSIVDSMTTRYTDPESLKVILNENKLEIPKKEAWWMEMDKYLYLRLSKEEKEEKKYRKNTSSSSPYNYSPNHLTQKELEKMEREENRRDRMDSDEWEYEDGEEREYWESEEYWNEEGIEKEVY